MASFIEDLQSQDGPPFDHLSKVSMGFCLKRREESVDKGGVEVRLEPLFLMDRSEAKPSHKLTTGDAFTLQ